MSSSTLIPPPDLRCGDAGTANLNWWVAPVISIALWVLGTITFTIRSYIIQNNRRQRKSKRWQKKFGLQNNQQINSIGDESSLPYDALQTSENVKKEKINFCSHAQRLSEALISPLHLSGKILQCLHTLLSSLSWAVYIWKFSLHSPNLVYGFCEEPIAISLTMVDFSFNLYFFIFLVIRFFATTNKVRFWFERWNIMDILTLPPAVMALGQSRQFPGFAFIRSLIIMSYTETLTHLRILRSDLQISLCHAVLYIVCIWMTNTGIMHILENTGDFWLDPGPNNSQNWTFGDTAYFLIVSMSTVGYGDLASKTVLGRVYVLVIILAGLAVFAGFLPQVYLKISENMINAGRYARAYTKRQIIVDGDFDDSTIEIFLSGFYDESNLKHTKWIKLVIMDQNPPDFKRKTIYNTYRGLIYPLQGSFMRQSDLERANIYDASGAIILVRPTENDCFSQDHVNILKAFSLKKINPFLPVILQLNRYENKFLLHNLPRWNTVASDIVFSIEEIKMGLLALNCLSFGLSTLLTNFLFNASPKKAQKEWRRQYQEGMRMQIYDSFISCDFKGISFKEFALLVYQNWGICVVALRVEERNMSRLVINPDEKRIREIIPQSMRAVLIAPSEKECKLVENYCEFCTTIHLKKCRCTDPKVHLAENKIEMGYQNKSYSPSPERKESIDIYQNESNDSVTFQKEVIAVSDVDTLLACDKTGSVHWCSTVDFDDCFLTTQAAHEKQFTNHILVCIPTYEKSENTSINFLNFVIPLRLRFLTGVNYHAIVILCDAENINKKEWINLCHFPNLYFISGDPLSNADLSAVNLQYAYSVVVLSPSNGNEMNEEELLDRDVLLCITRIYAHLDKVKKSIPITTELACYKNAPLFSTDNECLEDDLSPLHYTQPYARGQLFNSSVFYSCLSLLHFNPEVLNFYRTLFFGEDLYAMEAMLDEGEGFRPEVPKQTQIKSGSVLSIIPLQETPLNSYLSIIENEMTYALMWEKALMEHNLLCLGLYRLSDSGVRYVFTNPPKDTPLIKTDHVFCFQPASFKEATPL